LPGDQVLLGVCHGVTTVTSKTGLDQYGKLSSIQSN